MGLCVLLTGVTGFLGKVVLEELLRRHSEYELDNVFIITRPKKGQDAKTRFLEKIVLSPCFSRLPKTWVHSVQVVEGDLSEPNCGIDLGAYEKICTKVTHIIHCAGSVSFELPIAEAIAANINATLNVYDLARDCPRLTRIVSTSTAYVTPHSVNPMYETLVPLPYPASEILEDIRLGKIGEELLRVTGHPNTYTLTKCIAEHLVMERKDNIPLTIVRPSIISASKQFPFPGWIDSHAAFAAFIAAIGAGILHVVDANPKVLLDVVPVDTVANILVNEALFPSPEAINSRIVHAVATLKNAIKIQAAVTAIQEYFQKKPAYQKCRTHYLGPRNITFHFQDFIRHKIPLSVARLFYILKGDVKMQKQVEKAAWIIALINRVFPNFTNHTYDFRPSRPILEEFDVEEYVNLACQGVEEHLLKKI
jgi:fatty acyl-CoA reductase